ncbi:MAG: protein translocase SEC61 complex subunit gamma [Candidatus Thermoplasmatota archaeon]|nr:protein translocase SEC61 complex subunit gamma [Candidatus Thermoplasmatota archaeon]
MSDIVERSWDLQRKIEEKTRHIGKGKYGRVLKMARKPSGEEYVRISQIVAIGLMLLGGLGFLIYWLFEYGSAMVARAFG